MNRRSLLQGLLALPVVGAVGGCRHRHHGGNGGGTSAGVTRLLVVVEGQFAIVLQKNNRWRVRVFTPADPDHLHKLQFLGGSERFELKNAFENRSNNFELATDGLKTSFEKPEFHRLGSLNVETDQWCQENYPMTVDLPPPKRISSVLPLVRVTFESGKQGCMPVVRVLEYDVTDVSKVRMLKEAGEEHPPTPCTALIKRYTDACQQHEEGQHHPSDSRQAQSTISCSERSKQLASFFHESDVLFFFGTGLTSDKHPEHPTKFFNEQILKSFPGLQKLKLKEIRPQEECPNQETDSRSDDPEGRQSAPRFREAAYVPDCTASGPTVTFPVPLGG